MTTTLAVVRGTISSVAFECGDRFVVGNWASSPIGRLADVMWVDADGRRTLLTTDECAAEFIQAIYRFDDVRLGPLEIDGDTRRTEVLGHGVAITLHGGRRRPVPFPRPRWLTRWVEAPIARRLMGVETHGLSPTGVREWYQTTGWCWIERAIGTRDGNDLGAMCPIERPLGVGFSDPPARPSIVGVRVTIDGIGS